MNSLLLLLLCANDRINASLGDIVRTWRKQRGLSQLHQKHVSFIESGRATPSRDMVLQIAEQLDVPLRERNAMLLAVSFAPMFRDRPRGRTPCP